METQTRQEILNSLNISEQDIEDAEIKRMRYEEIWDKIVAMREMGYDFETIEIELDKLFKEVDN